MPPKCTRVFARSDTLAAETTDTYFHAWWCAKGA